MAKTRFGCCRKLKTAALIVMLIGVLLLACFLPGWVWGTVLGIALISAGFLIWRFL